MFSRVATTCLSSVNIMRHSRSLITSNSVFKSSDGFGIPKPSLGTTPKTPAGAQELYDEWADSYDATLNSWGYEAPKRTVSLATSHANSTQMPLVFLDAGCGTGLVGRELQNYSKKMAITGIDISQKSLDLCEEKNKGVYTNLRLASMEFSASSQEDDIPSLRGMFNPSLFDGIVCVGVLSYISNLHSLFEEWIRISKQGGVIAFTIRDDDSNTKVLTQAEEVMKTLPWELKEELSRMPYMPHNPDPTERAKTIKYFVFKVM
eukprot:m.345052 g.345052  ORF g.345052 m.345052 type:complete len:262 (+) comp25695_c0_seq1:195-980(+)